MKVDKLVLNSPIMNPKTTDDLSDCEVKIIVMIRKLRLYDEVKIGYVKQGELRWQLTQSDRGVYNSF